MFDRITSAAPLLLRLAGGYGAVITDDVQSALDAVGRRLWLGVMLGVAALLTLLLASTWVIAWSWDTPWRMWAIGGLTGVFALVSLVTCIVLQTKQTWPNGLLPQTRLELSKDQRLVEDLLANKPSGVE